MFKKLFNILAITSLASQSVYARYKMAKQCQMVNNLIHKTDAVESCCFFDRVVCDSEMRNVIQLNLSNLDLTYVDEDVFKLPLVALDLSGNKNLKEIPEEIKDLTHLEVLNLSDLPNLTELPDSITLLKNLNILILNNDTNLKKLPVNFGNLSKLNQLYATSSGLESLPETIINLKKLVIINVSASKNLSGRVPELSKGVICDYSETNICHDENVEYPAKWSLPHDIYCDKVLSSVNMGMTDTNANAPVDEDEEGDDEGEDEDYRCGKKYGVCANGGCCSKWGYCGTTDAHCKVEKECQPEYGICIDSNGEKIGVVVEPVSKTTTVAPATTTTVPPVATTTTTTTKPASTTEAAKATPDVPENYRCGKGYGSCGRGQCCSKFGWCGTSEEFCSASTCQKEYGVCWNKNTNSSSQTKYKSVPGRCGSLYGKCPDGLCCSKYGWCGTSESYCAANKCQSE
jgi:hypothetical protein